MQLQITTQASIFIFAIIGRAKFRGSSLTCRHLPNLTVAWDSHQLSGICSRLPQCLQNIICIRVSLSSVDLVLPNHSPTRKQLHIFSIASKLSAPLDDDLIQMIMMPCGEFEERRIRYSLHDSGRNRASSSITRKILLANRRSYEGAKDP